jgi:glycosyltransferase involved in cell wall biosynthesis
VLRQEIPGLTVSVVGDGWWADELAEEARRCGVDDIVEFTGFATETLKHQELARAWVLALPSLKEGWGLVVLEAAGYGVPTVGYASAGGVAESVVDGETGLLADTEDEFRDALRRLLLDQQLRERLGTAALARSFEFGWDTAARAFGDVLAHAAGRTRVAVAPEAAVAHLEHDHDVVSLPEPQTTKAVTPQG